MASAAGVKSEATPSRPWLFSSMARDQADTIMRNYGAEDGLFLVRKSSSVPGAYALTCCFNRMISHHLLSPRTAGGFNLNDHPIALDCCTLEEVIEYLSQPRKDGHFEWSTPLTHYPAQALPMDGGSRSSGTPGGAASAGRRSTSRQGKAGAGSAADEVVVQDNPLYVPIVAASRVTCRGSELIYKVEMRNPSQLSKLKLPKSQAASCSLKLSNTLLILLYQVNDQGQTLCYCWPLELLSRFGDAADRFSIEAGSMSQYPGSFDFYTSLAGDIYERVKIKVQNIIDGSLGSYGAASLTGQRGPAPLPSKKIAGGAANRIYDSPHYEMMPMNAPAAPPGPS